MVILEPFDDGRTTVRFVIEAQRMHGASSVVGDFNDWEPGATPFTMESNDRSVLVASIVCGPGRYEYRFLCDSSGWLDDLDANDRCEGAHGSWNAVLTVEPAMQMIDHLRADSTGAGPCPERKERAPPRRYRRRSRVSLRTATVRELSIPSAPPVPGMAVSCRNGSRASE